MSTIVTRAGKGSALTHNEVDANFTNLNTDKVEKSGTDPVVISVNSSSDALRITQVGTGNALVVEDSANPDSSPFVIDADGFTVVGAATRTTGYLDYAGNNRTPVLQTQGISISGGGMTATNWGNSTFPSGLFLAKSRGGSVGTRGVVLNNDNIGAVLFSGDDATNFIPGAAIFGQVDGTPGTNDMPGRLVFSTTADGASTPTERMRLTSTGDLRFNSGYGSVATAYGCRAWVNFNGTGTVAIRESGNVSSITDNGTGDYTVNFATAMPDANYAAAMSSANAARNPGDIQAADYLAGSVRYLVRTGASATASVDTAISTCVIFR